MSSAARGEIPADAAAIARRYLRLERPASSAVALLAGVIAATAIVYLPLGIGLLIALVMLALVRLPLYRTTGTTRLATDAPTSQVRADFEGVTPPVLPFQWGIADDVSATANGARYDVSYLFGLRSVTMATAVQSVDTDADTDSDTTLELTVTANGKPWATYTIALREHDDETLVDIAWTSDRRFGLRRLPQRLIADRYYSAALTAQGYRVLDRDVSLSL